MHITACDYTQTILNTAVNASKWVFFYLDTGICLAKPQDTQKRWCKHGIVLNNALSAAFTGGPTASKYT